MDFKVLKQPKVFITTAFNIFALLENIDILNFCNMNQETYTKIVWLIVFVAVQFGIMNQPKDPNIIDKITNMTEIE